MRKTRRQKNTPCLSGLHTRAHAHTCTRACALHRSTSFAFANVRDQGGHGRARVLRRTAELSGPCRPLSSADSEQPCLCGVAHTLDLKLRFGPAVLCLVALETIAFGEMLFDSLQCGSHRRSWAPEGGAGTGGRAERVTRGHGAGVGGVGATR